MTSLAEYKARAQKAIEDLEGAEQEHRGKKEAQRETAGAAKSRQRGRYSRDTEHRRLRREHLNTKKTGIEQDYDYGYQAQMEVRQSKKYQ